ncbi:MAG: SMC-Scp complex subunit ScpB [Gammaproteobacteria bacterium]|nr:SMC-Scp complex subunit ScpB [Gammaproteobacteria bacterium]
MLKQRRRSIKTMDNLSLIIEALLFSSSRPLSEKEILSAFDLRSPPTSSEIKEALKSIEEKYSKNSIELVKVASGYRLRIRQEYSSWVAKLWEAKPQKYSRALLETLALIAYKQPITRGEIEEVRGVSVSSQIIRTLLDRSWIKVVGHRDVPGRPALFSTTKDFLDDLNLSKLSDLPELPEIQNIPEEAQISLLNEPSPSNSE